MSPEAHVISISPNDMAPVVQWLEEIRDRLEGWSKGIRSASVEEWNRFHTAVTSSLSLRRVEGVLREFLAHIGLTARVSQDEVTHAWIHELRIRVIYYREGLTIESYSNHLVEPPAIQL